MKWRMRIELLFVIPVAMLSGAAAMPPINVDNKSDARIEILPVDDAHRSLMPQGLQNPAEKLPSGSFILVNHTDRAITAVATVWTYTDLDGSLRQRKLNCDAYTFAPLVPIVKANDLSLIAPTGCTSQDLFPRLTSGSLHDAAVENAISSDPKSTIHVYVDSVVFDDGGIWGPDKSHYFTEIEDRYFAVQKFTTEVATAKSAGEAMPSLLAKIHDDARQKTDKLSARMAYYAGLLLRSPNAEGTLLQLKAQTVPPQFHHLGGQPR
jgi:hypothetical protein